MFQTVIPAILQLYQKSYIYVLKQVAGIAQLAGLVQSTARVAREVMVEVTVEVTYQNVISLFVKSEKPI